MRSRWRCMDRLIFFWYWLTASAKWLWFLFSISYFFIRSYFLLLHLPRQFCNSGFSSFRGPLLNNFKSSFLSAFYRLYSMTRVCNQIELACKTVSLRTCGYSYSHCPNDVWTSLHTRDDNRASIAWQPYFFWSGWIFVRSSMRERRVLHGSWIPRDQRRGVFLPFQQPIIQSAHFKAREQVKAGLSSHWNSQIPAPRITTPSSYLHGKWKLRGQVSSL